MLDDGDIVVTECGRNIFIRDLLSKAEQSNEKFEIYLDDIELKIKSKTILQKTSLKLSSGTFVGVIGNSGSGKSSFLKLLAGVKNKHHDIYLKSKFKSFLNFSYLGQEHHLIPSFTVKEHLEYKYDFLQLDKSVKAENISKVLHNVILESKKDNIAVNHYNNASELSGGQLKRLAVAIELISNPDVMILDEPTSGLSSEDTSNIMRVLKNISTNNKLVVCSLHKPNYETLLQLDMLLIIDDGGFPVYYGKPLNAADYIRQQANLIDKRSKLETNKNASVILEILGLRGNNQQRVIDTQTMYRKYADSNKYNCADFDLLRKYTPKLSLIKSVYSYFNLAIKLDFKQKLKFCMLVILPLIIGCLFAILCRYSYSEQYTFSTNPNIPQWIFISLITSVFVGLVSSSHEYIFLRNFHSNEFYLIKKSLSLLISKIFKAIIISTIQTCFLLIPALFILEAQFFISQMFVSVFLMVLWGSFLGLIISKISKTVAISYLLIPLVIIPQLLFSGIILEFRNFNQLFAEGDKVPVVAKLVPCFWAFEATMIDFDTRALRSVELYEKMAIKYEADYYLNYFIPELSKLDQTKIDSVVLAESLINADFSNYKEIDKLTAHYKQLEKAITYNIDSTVEANPNLKFYIRKNTNKAVNLLLKKLQYNKIIKLNDNIWLRNYYSQYNNLPSKNSNDCHFIAEKILFGKSISCFAYNSLFILLYAMLLIVVLVFIEKINIGK